MRSPAVLELRVSTLVRFYRWRLRAHPIQEALATTSIAAGIALLVSVLIANASIAGSVRELVHGIAGAAQLQLAARSADGMPDAIAARAARLPQVAVAAPLLRQQVTLVGPGGRRAALLLGVTPALASLGGRLTDGLALVDMRRHDGLVLPQRLAESVGARPGAAVTVLVRGRAHRVRVHALLGEEAIGSLAESQVAIAPLQIAQRVADLPERISHVLVRPQPSSLAATTAALRALTAGQVDVAPADRELRLLATASRPNDVSTGLFAVIGAMAGIVLGVLLTVPERRRWAAELRLHGFSWRQVLLALGFDAVLLGLAASAAGLLLGDVLARALFRDVPTYLAFAFPVGTQRIVTAHAVLAAVGSGVAAAALASVVPALAARFARSDAMFRRATAPGETVGRGTTIALGAGGVTLAVSSVSASLLVPELTVLAGLALAAAMVCVMPAGLALVTGALARATCRSRRSMLALAVGSIRATATRSIAIASVAALALYGCVALLGARSDLVRGLDQTFGEFLGTADVWVTTGGDDLTTDAFAPPRASRDAIARLPQVHAVRQYHGGLFDLGDRRVWVIARPPSDRAMVPASQLVAGELGTASRRLRAGGWAALSQSIADARGARVGDAIVLPTPRGRLRLRVAAITTNLGWPPGALILNAHDFQRGWEMREPTALHVDLRPGTTPAAGARAVRTALGSTPALRVQTAAERQAQYARLSRQGLRRLDQIAALLLATAGGVAALALAAVVWQRRPRLAVLKVDGFAPQQLWRWVILESTILLLLGATIGTAVGVCGHALASRWLEITTGFPAPFSLEPWHVLGTLAALATIALGTVTVAAYAATRVAPDAAFEE